MKDLLLRRVIATRAVINNIRSSELEQRRRGDLAGRDGEMEFSALRVGRELQDEREGTEHADHGGILSQSPMGG